MKRKIINKKEKVKNKKIRPQSQLVKILFNVGLWIVAIVSILALSLGVLNFAYADNVFPRISIGNYDVSGQTRQQIQKTLETINKQILSNPVIFSSGETSAKVDLNDIDYKIDIAKNIDALFRIGRRSNPLLSFVDQTRALIYGYNLKPDISYDQTKFDIVVSKVHQSFGQPEVDATLSIKGTTISEIAEKSGTGISNETIISDLSKQLIDFNQHKTIIVKTEQTQPKVYSEGLTEAKTQAQTMISAPINISGDDLKIIIPPEKIGAWINFAASDERVMEGRGLLLKASIDSNKVKIYTLGIAKTIDREPINAKLSVTDGKIQVISAPQTGLKLDQDKLNSLISDAASSKDSRNIKIPIKVTDPEVSDEKVKDLGIAELIGTATTSFTRSPDNRVHNIQNGAQFLNGKLIKPGDTFSTIQALGSIDDKSGYLPELVIKENKTQPEFGGGLCQVSTTLFRAALKAGLPIVERQNHSWRISYYEPPVGLDATIYFPKPDFRFTNDTPGWILIESSVDATAKKITFNLWGTKDGRRAEVVGPKLLSSTQPGPAEYADDPTMDVGQEKQIEKQHPGGSAIAYYKVYNKDGKLINDQTFVSKYKAVTAKFLRGTKPPDNPAPESPPAQ